jgi:hypothetical protein
LPVFDAATRRRLNKAGYEPIALDIEAKFRDLTSRRKAQVLVGFETEIGVTLGHCSVLWQASLHRACKLLATSGYAIGHRDFHGTATLVRSILETVAVLGSVTWSLVAWSGGKMTYEEYDAVVKSALVGSRFEEHCPTATNILTHIKRADKLIGELSLSLMKDPLSTCYGALSDVAHPNFSSNKASFAMTDLGVFDFTTPSGDALELVGILGEACRLHVRIGDILEEAVEQR